MCINYKVHASVSAFQVWIGTLEISNLLRIKRENCLNFGLLVIIIIIKNSEQESCCFLSNRWNKNFLKAEGNEDADVVEQVAVNSFPYA